MTDSQPLPGRSLSRNGRFLILAVAFGGWAFAGVQMSITGIVMRVAVADLLPAGTSEGEIGQWFGWMVCAFLLGAATGGYAFGYLGDRIGRSKAMAASILCYSAFSALTWFVDDPWVLLALRFLTCLGVGGIWPNGVALLAEAWSSVSRPILAGVIGTAANVGICAFAFLTLAWHVTGDDWRWTMLVGAAPIVLGAFGWAFVPESPTWLNLQARRDKSPASEATSTGVLDSRPDRPSKKPGFSATVRLGEVFRPPILGVTAIGILLGTVPLFGGWGVSNWANAWASEVGDGHRPQGGPAVSRKTEPGGGKPDPTLKSWTMIARSLPSSISSLFGGALAYFLGRKRSYFLLSLCAFICTQALFRVPDPNDPAFLFWMAALGFCSGFFFGWLPLCLPELFPTRVRATGAGVSFNWGRILTTAGILVSAFALKEAFEGRYADIGRITGFIYLLGMLVILFAPDATEQGLDDEVADNEPAAAAERPGANESEEKTSRED